MFKVIGIFFLGIAIGFLLKNLQKLGKDDAFFNRALNFIKKHLSLWISACVFFLLLILGISIGGNESILSNLDTLGLQALVLTLFGIGGSVFFAWLIYKIGNHER